MSKDKPSYYETLDISFNANSESIRTAYIRAKNAYNRDSLAAYSLFDKEDSKRILDEIEEAFSVLCDSEKRRRYDESHGIISSESVYDSYHKGNHAVAAFSRDGNRDEVEPFSFEPDPFRKGWPNAETPPPPRNTALSNLEREKAAPFSSAPSSPLGGSSLEREKAAPFHPSVPNHIERLKALQDSGQPQGTARSGLGAIHHETDPDMEDRIKNCASVNGAFLKSVREYKRVSTDEIMNVLKISKSYLNALEEDDLARLPANVFVRGFVIQYAKALRLDHDKVAGSYMEFLRSKRP
jgi:hypothetical protein